MGMYTELYVNCAVEAKGLSELQLTALKIIFADSDEPNEELLKQLQQLHPLFSTARWGFMAKCQSYYFNPRGVRSMEWDEIGEYYCITSRSSFKDYNNESELLFDFLKTLSLSHEGLIGYSLYEESTFEPTLYFYGEQND